jgi:hypothetical protein
LPDWTVSFAVWTCPRLSGSRSSPCRAALPFWRWDSRRIAGSFVACRTSQPRST